MRIRHNLSAAVTTVVLIYTAASPISAEQFIDASANSITISRPPQRIISLLPSVTEILFSLGLSGRIAADTNYCDYPLAAKTLPKIGDYSVNYERLLGLHPDLVVGDAEENSASLAKCRSLHLQVAAIDGGTLSGIERSFTLLGKITDRSRLAAKRVAEIEAKRKFAAVTTAHDHRPKERVFVVINSSPLWTAGSKTFINDVVVEAGGVNAAGDVSGYVPYSKERLLSCKPTIIIASKRNAERVKTDPAFLATPAGRSHRILVSPTNPNWFGPGHGLLMR